MIPDPADVHGWRFAAAAAPPRLVPSVRARSALAAVVVVAFALVSGAALLVHELQRSLLTGLEQAATTRGAEVATRLTTGGEGNLDADLKAGGYDGQLVQVVSPDGEVVASSSWRSGQEPITGLRAEAGQVRREDRGLFKIVDTDRPFLAQARGVTFGGRTWTVLVASFTQDRRASVITVVKLLLIGFPAVLLLVGVSIWVLIGRALDPVEQIRARVAGIGAGRLDERVPVPPTRDEIARLAITMNRMLDRLQASQRAQRQFVADASHELRSPLATLSATLEVAGTHISDVTWREVRAVGLAETGRLAALVENLLLLARVDDEGLRIDEVDVDLDDLLEQEARRLRTAGRPGLVVTTAIRPVRVRGDHLRLSQMLRNLVDNAGRHARGTVRLGLREVDGEAWLMVDDDGPGVPEADRERVFERFVRLDDSRSRASGGAGLGLPIVREVVVAHGGQVTITRSPDGGCRSLVRLPGSSGNAPLNGSSADTFPPR